MIHLRCHILQKKIGKRDRGHSFYNNDCAGNDYRVVSSVDDVSVFSCAVFIVSCGIAIEDVGFTAARTISRAVAHASKRTSGMICLLYVLLHFNIERIVIFEPTEEAA